MQPTRWMIALLAWIGVGAAMAGTDSDLLHQSAADADAKSVGCLSCHHGIEAMHESPLVRLGCSDCHGGDATVSAADLSYATSEYAAAQQRAHVHPSLPDEWRDPANPGRISSANPKRSYTLLNRESPQYIRFVNPGDLRVAAMTCGSSSCHESHALQVPTSLMATSAMLWGGAAYNNGIVPFKRSIFGESYGRNGVAQRIRTTPAPNAMELARGVVPFLMPLPRWQVTQAPDPLRAFERGGRVDRSVVSEVGNPNLGAFIDEPGRPDMKLGTRGLGTDLRVSAGVLNLHKTRLNDPYLWFMGTNDQPGDYRSSGCTACHVVYANDRSPISSGSYSAFGNAGMYAGEDPTIPKNEPGHPIRHRLTRAIPTSQCMVCHMHQPNSFVNTFLGYQLWDYETDGELLWPAQQRLATSDRATPFNERDWQAVHESLEHNPEEAATRGLWTNIDFLAQAGKLDTKQTKFADYHGHGWMFRAVDWQDRQGNLLDKNAQRIAADDPDRLAKAVHLQDIHAEKGMHCVDCHFTQDTHGDGKLYSEYPDAVEIRCQDCHGTINAYAPLRSTGPAAAGGRDLLAALTPFGERRFERFGNTVIQRSMIEPGLQWEVSQVLDSIDPSSSHYNEKARLAKTMQRDGKTWGGLTDERGKLAHDDEQMACFTCHTSWMTSCFGCHLPQQADWKKDAQHFEGGATRNWTSYNPQVIRYDAFMLARHSNGKHNIVAPARSSSAVMISSTNANRERIYSQQAPVSAAGFSSQAFNAHFAHTVRKEQTRTCDDCHVSAAGDNNAWLAQVLTLGTNFVNFMGRFVWVGEGEDGIEAVAVTEADEPQAVIGSRLQRLAYPSNYERHVGAQRLLGEAYHHNADDVRSLQLRGEYVYTANGPGGLRVFDVANIDNKGFSERIVSAPVSPLGQRAYVKTKYAMSVALPTNMPIYYGRSRDPANAEQPMHPLYRYAYVADREEGLVVVDVDMLGDGDPSNNFLERAATFNPDGALNGARFITLAGNYAYILAERGLVIVSLDDPTAPRLVTTLGAPALVEPRAITIQFRYAFVSDAEGLKVLDITTPQQPRLVSQVPISEAGDLCVARTYAYVPAGSQGVVIVDVEKPEHPVIAATYNAGGALADSRAVRVGAAYGSVYAYVADGRNGMQVLQLLAAGEDPQAAGFSPPPHPQLIATYRTHGPAVALSKGMERDRAVDESGNQISVFGRFGSRPFTLTEMERLFLRNGSVWTVSSAPPSAPQEFIAPVRPEAEGPPAVQPAAPRPQRLLPGRW